MFHILKSDGDQRLVFGWASVSVTVDGDQVEDLQGDAIDPEELEKAAYQYVLDFRDAGEMHDQGLRKKARLVESCVFTPEKLKAMRIPEGTVPLGWWVGFYVDDDEAWEKIKDGNLIFFQESEDSLYFSSGMATGAVTASICQDWGVKQNYTYESITHEELTLEGALSDIFLSDLLGAVEKQKGTRFVMRSREDIIDIAPFGANTTVYKLHELDTVTNTRSRTTMDGVVTKIKILGSTDDSGASNTEAVVTGDTAKYGTIQKIQKKDTDKSLSDAQEEANTQIDENGAPKVEFEVNAIDIPWIRKGDKVRVEAGNMLGDFFVTGVSRKIRSDEKMMTLTCVHAG